MARRPLTGPLDASLGSVLDFMRLLWRIEHGLQATSKRMESELGITGPQRLVLKVVTRFPGVSAGDLAQILHLHPSTVTGIVQRLIDKRLLLRERHASDTRRICLRPRGKARTVARRSAGTVEAVVARALRRVPAHDVARARAVLEAVASAFD